MKCFTNKFIGFPRCLSRSCPVSSVIVSCSLVEVTHTRMLVKLLMHVTYWLSGSISSMVLVCSSMLWTFAKTSFFGIMNDSFMVSKYDEHYLVTNPRRQITPHLRWRGPELLWRVQCMSRFNLRIKTKWFIRRLLTFLLMAYWLWSATLLSWATSTVVLNHRRRRLWEWSNFFGLKLKVQAFGDDADSE